MTGLDLGFSQGVVLPNTVVNGRIQRAAVKGEQSVTKFGVLAVVLFVVLMPVAACGKPAPIGPSVTTIQRASPPIPAPAPLDFGPQGPGRAPPEDPVEWGIQLALQHGCAGCHTVDGEPSIGPTWQGIFGSREDLEDGSSVTVNAEYITESIRTPEAKVVKGFDPVMLTFDAETISAEEIGALIAYIESVK